MRRLFKGWLWLAALAFIIAGPVAAEESLIWHPATETVDADVHHMALWPFLEEFAHKTGWNIYVEPGTDKVVSTKFKNLPMGAAFKMIFGGLNYALVPSTNGPTCLYIFTTTMKRATKAVPTARKPRHVANELIVKLKKGANIDALARLVGAKVIGRNDKLGIYKLKFADAASTDAALSQLQSNPDVQAVDYNYYFNPPPAPQPLPSGMTAPAQPSLTLDPPSQNDPCTVLVGLIDTPIQTLPANVAQFVQPQISVAGDPAASYSTPTHATGMAQTIVAGVAANTTHSSIQILPVDVYGSSSTATSWNVALGIQAAVDRGANVLNLSLGSSGDSTVLDSVVQQAVSDGVLVFAAAGNQPVNTPTYPAAIPGVNSVTALSQPGQLASYANYGSFSDMALPGTSFISSGGQTWVMQGTSVSTAYATGIASGIKTSNCDGWPQIQTAMEKKFVVPTGQQ